MSGIPRRIAGQYGSSGEFQIPSSESKRFYYPRLTVTGERATGWCSCEGFLYRRDCRHLVECRAILQGERREIASRVIQQTTYGTYDPALDRTPVVIR